MYHYFDDVRNVHGEVLAGFFLKLVDATTNLGATLYSDANLTPIATVSGVADAAIVDDDGNLNFYVGEGTYHLDYYAADGVTFVKRIQNIPMNSSIFQSPNFATLTVTGNASIGGTLNSAAVAASGAVTSTASIGYATGAGGTVTQLTSKSTDVTLNAQTGQITLNNASLASNGTVSFVCNNTKFGINDFVEVKIASGTTSANAYLVQADNDASNAFRISITNRTAGALGEALVLKFFILKAVPA